MHELSIVKNLIEIIGDSLKDYDDPVPERINLKVGEFSGIVVDSLLFAFDAVKEDTIFSEAEMNIEEIPFKGKCSSCGEEFGMNDRFIMLCPKCNSEDVEIISGKELLIDSVDIKEE